MIKIGKCPECVTADELDRYLNFMQKKYPSVTEGTLDIMLDGDYVELDMKSKIVPFQRIRRITGYLVGTLDRFNNAKRSEVDDRIKHVEV